MKTKMIYSNFDKETGISTVTIRTDLGDITGTSKLHEEDRNIMSEYAGCQYAETRAVLKYMKLRIKNLNLEIKGLENCQKALEQKATYDPQELGCRTLRKQIHILKRERYNWQSKYKSLSDKLYKAMCHRQDILDKIIKRREIK